ncbi:FliH/SctL family protein [Sporanaerobium hydrogeniformans]|uniref:FliH/SctL family protein n=1 Tax=Sporanaerobium hydrogeniformans TaxID=3072179 RepID=UPI0015D472AA|nr:FliH/SctL family protein [Sporanaerobium hydrogeniformans]
MSSIIKGGRVRNQTVIALKDRSETNYVASYMDNDENQNNMGQEEREQSWEKHIQNMLREAQINAEKIIEEANRQKGVIINEALQEADQIIEKAIQSKEEILKEGEDYKENRKIEANQEAEVILQKAYEEKEALIAATEGELVQTLCKLLDYLIGEEVYHHTAWLTCIVKRMLSHENFEDQIHIKVSPQVLERLTEEEEKALKALGKQVEIEADNHLSNTICKVVTAQGSIEYDVIQGLERVISELKLLQNLNKE